MSKWKRFLSRILVLTMLFSALTGVVSAKERLDPNEASKAIQTSVDDERTYLKDHVVIAEYDSRDRSMKYSTQKLYTISAPDREYTVKNVGGPQDGYLYVYCYKYTSLTGETLREEYGNKVANKDSLEAFPKGNVPVYLKKHLPETTDMLFLSKERTWIDGIRIGTDEKVLHIEEGQEITFTLPDAKEGDIYQLCIIAYYPDAESPNNIGLEAFNILIDTDGVYPTGDVDPGKNISAPVMEKLERKKDNKLQALGSEYGGIKVLWVLPLGDSAHAAPGQTFTVVHTGQNPAHTISVRVRKYTLTSARKLREWYKENEIMDLPVAKLPNDDTEVYYCFNDDKNVYYLTTDGVLKTGFDGFNDDGVLQIRSGEKVSFTLPEAEDGVLYDISFHSGDSTVSYFVVIDETAKVVSDVTTSEQKESLTFTDIPDGAYYADSVAWAVERGITTGTTATTFSPNDTCTKAQILTLLWRAYGETAVDVENPFGDVSEKNYYYQAALWAYENGLVEGEIFDGSAPCTRAMTVTYLWKLSGKQSARPCDFADVDSSAEYAEAVAWAVSEGITNGTSETTFSPDATCTRGQIVTLLHRALRD